MNVQSGPSLRKRLVFWMVLVGIAAALVEGGARVFGAVFYGWRVLAWGTRRSLGSTRAATISWRKPSRVGMEHVEETEVRRSLGLHNVSYQTFAVGTIFRG
jgi:hypothetical protein